MADAKDKGKGKGPKIKGKPPGHQMVKKALKPGKLEVGRGASAFAPGRSGNLPPGQGGVPPGQLKKAVNDATLNRYLAAPVSDYALTYGRGYAGNGYYWAPRGMPYFHEAPDVRFYPNRNQVPDDYWQSRYDRGNAYEVQAALADMGYYNGPIDGSIGPRSRDAIARYQAAQGLPVTGRIDSGLTRALSLY